MGKSMYSLMLSDEVIRVIDRMAYERSASRSGLVNEILAEYISMVTPEEKIRRIFHSAVESASKSGGLRLHSPPSGSQLSLRSAVNYKYNPTIRYCVELSEDGSRYVGEFRVLSRSQSRALLDRLNAFYDLWSRVEREVSGHGQAEIADGRYRRPLRVEQEDGADESGRLGEAIGSYLRVFDRSMDLFFSGSGQPEHALFEQIKRIYDDFLCKSDIIL